MSAVFHTLERTLSPVGRGQGEGVPHYPESAVPPHRAAAHPLPTGERVEEGRLAEAYVAAAAVCDPEIPVLTIEDLGVLRDVKMLSGGAIEVTITPTYSGCPAMDVIGVDVQVALAQAGFENARVRLVLSPAWTTDWLSAAGRAKLAAYGIAPPKAGARRALFGEEAVACPHCGSASTEKLAEFGSTACKALWRCKGCREPFDYFKCL